MRFKFKDGAEAVETDSIFYDLILGGYINPEELLASEEQSDEVKLAIETIMDFIDELRDAGLLKEY